MEIAGCVPIALLHGDVQCGKSTIMEAAVSLMGTSTTKHLLKGSTDLQFLLISSQTTLGLVLDDVTDYTNLLEKVMLLFDGKAVAHQRTSVKPRTSFMTAVNLRCFSGLSKHPRLVEPYIVYTYDLVNGYCTGSGCHFILQLVSVLCKSEVHVQCI